MRGGAQYVAECFSNSSLFHKALKEAFESFCNKQVAGSSSAELMANFCDNLLKKARACGEPCLQCKSACRTWELPQSRLYMCRGFACAVPLVCAGA